MRHTLLPLFVLAFGLAVLPVNAPTMVRAAEGKAAEAKMPKDTCVKECFACAVSCIDCMKYCSGKGHKAHAKMLEVCHLSCLMCGNGVDGKTKLAWETCELCEKMCNECAEMCEKGDDMMKKTAAECRKCAKACADARK